MDSMIAVLPPHVIDQIAAGEVIERPASVVKELIDNAIDAGAKAIAIEVLAGGRSLVRVTDDGSGMSPADARLALERFATSKLRVVDDLWGLPTMGFRGEALPSIASVSRLTLVTRRAGDLAATRIVVEGGRVVLTDEVGAPAGTTVEVVDLLGNVPARLKFLKGEATEASHVTELVSRIAMAHPKLHLRLKHNGRTALDVPPDRDGFARAQALLGTRIASRMVTATGEENGVRVVAYLGAPELAQTTARGVQLFVGNRPIRDRGLLHAIAMGYGELVPRGRYPVAVVLVDAPAGSVDINVHPQKLEVRFADPAAACAAVRHVVAAAVAKAAWRSDSAQPLQMMAIASVAPPVLPFDGPATPLGERYAAQLSSLRGDTQRSFEASFVSGPRASEPGVRDWVHRVKSSVRAAEYRARADVRPPELAMGTMPGRAAESTGFFTTLRYLGQLDLTYLVCEAGGEMVLVDQHAAHERVELARLREAGRDVSIQRMLFPVTIEASPAQVELVGSVADVLAQVGYEAESFGKTTIAVKAVPAGIRHGDPAQLLRRLLDTWIDDNHASSVERLERVLAEIACHSVVRAGDRLSAGEAEALLRSLDANDLTANPHGRPMLLRIPIGEIARRFGR